MLYERNIFVINESGESMEQKKRRSANRSSSANGASNRNVRSASNSREVSRRPKGKNRYAYEDDRRAQAIYYDDDDNRRKKKQGASKRSKYNDSHNEKRSRKPRRRGRRKNGVSKTIGIILSILQFILSVILVVNILFFDILTPTYILVLVGVLIILLGITLLTQLGAKGKGIAGKVFCIVMCIILGTGSFYIGKVNNAFQKITGKNTKKNAMVVSVLKNDKAEKINDAADYNFGVQYVNGGDEIKSTVNQIEQEVGKTVKTTEYASMLEEVQALYNGDVEAIIYNAAQESIFSDKFNTFAEDTKEIYRHDIVISIDNEAVDASMNEVFTVYLSGIDVEGDITQTGRSDVNILAVVNPKIHQVLLVTTPRDYYVPIPGVSGGQEDKLTHAGTYGIDKSMATLGVLYDIDVQFFGRVNFTSMIQIVDALGGLDVESDQEFDTGWESGVKFHVNKGMNHFNGGEALAFCRERHNLPDGDNDRGRHQQAVITAIIKKMMSPAMLRGATDIIDSVSDGVDTNFSREQIQSLIKTQLRTNAKWNIYSVAAEGYGDKQTCYSSGSEPLYVTIPDETSVANIVELINKVENGETIEGSTVAE